MATKSFASGAMVVSDVATYTAYELYDKRRPGKPEYTGMTSMSFKRRHQLRLAAATSSMSTRGEPANAWIGAIGPDNVGHRILYEGSSKSRAEQIEQRNIATRTHVSVGGKNVRRR